MRTKEQFNSFFPVQINLPIQWGDMDAFGHVNNCMYFRYFESARLAYFGATGIMDDMHQLSVGPILATTDCQFKRALTYPDQIVVGATVTENHEFGFQMQYGVFSDAQQTVTTLGSGRIVLIQYDTGQKVKPTDKLLELIQQIQQKCENTGA